MHPSPSDLHVAGCRALGAFPRTPRASSEQQAPRGCLGKEELRSGLVGNTALVSQSQIRGLALSQAQGPWACSRPPVLCCKMGLLVKIGIQSACG